jgi:DNA repair exonuclease SbcCD nuclease subunit
MAKIVVFSDLHAHCFGPYSTVLEDGTNSRLQDALNVIEKVRQVANDVGADMVLFGGDLFHERRHIVTQAFSKVYEALSMFAVDRMPLFMIHGNHDQADKAGKFHALSPFGAFATVVDEPGWVTVQGKNTLVDILAVPYIEDTNHLLDVVHEKAPDSSNPKIFLGHFGLDGAKLGADFVYSNSNEPVIGNIPTGRFDVGFLGHFHLHQQLAPNFWYVGAPMHHNWGDKGQARGLMVYDTETKEAKHVALTNTPQFIELTMEEFNGTWSGSDPSVGDYIRVISDKPWTEDKIEESRLFLKARSLEVVCSRVQVDEAFEVRLDVEPGASYDEMVTEYVKSGLVDLDGLEEEWLVAVGHKILSEVSS